MTILGRAADSPASDPAPVGAEIDGVEAANRRGHPVLRRFLSQKGALIALGFILLVVVLAAVWPFIGQDPYQQDLLASLQPPSRAHWLGTDELGRDVLSRLFVGGGTTLLASFQAVALAVAIALPSGLLAGYVGGWADATLSRINDAFMSAPALVLAIAVVAVLGPGLTNAMIAVGLIFSPLLFRVVRASTLSVRSETYVEASRAIGCRRRRIMFKHVLLNVIPPVLVQVTLMLGTAMLAEASLSFLGLGVRPPTPSWGSMLRSAFDKLYVAQFLMFPPGIMIGLAVLSFSKIGDGLQRAISVGRRQG